MIDDVLFDQSLERERRRKRRGRLMVGVLVSALLVVPFYGLLAVLKFDGPTRIAGALAAAPAFVAVVMLVVGALGRLSAGAAMTFLHPGGRSSASVVFSHAEALAAAGKLDEASDAFDALRTQHGDTVALLRAEAMLHLAPGGNAARAKELLQRVRKAPDVTRGDELFATHRLIDLYLGPLQDRDRGMSELRRLADRFPGTPDANGALAALATLRDEPPSEHTA